MKKAGRLFIVYFPVILVAFQVLLNLLSFVFPQAYIDTDFYLNLMLGTNGLYALFLAVLTFNLKFCMISRACALAECCFAVAYGIIKVDNIYNISIQIIIGTAALIITYLQYKKKFPLCRLSLYTDFICSVVKQGSCKKGFDQWAENTKSIIVKKQLDNGNH